MALADFKVIRVVCGCDLYNACTEFHINIFIGNNRDLSVGKRELNHLAYYALISFIIGVNGYSTVTEECFGTCCCYLDTAASVCKRIAYVPEEAVLLFIFALDI